jgi:hypothetical protein
LVHNQGRPLFSWFDEVYSGNFIKDQPTSVLDPHHIDADPGSTYHLDADSISSYHPDADPDPDPDLTDPSFQIKAQTLEKMLKYCI